MEYWEYIVLIMAFSIRGGAVHKLVHMGLFGVDVFLLLSGMGLCKSMDRGCSLSAFYKNRITRVLYPYLLIAIPMQGIIDCVSGTSAVQYVLDISTLSYWLQHRGAWYVAMLIPLYAVFPFLWKAIRKHRHPEFAAVVCAVILSYSTYYTRKYWEHSIGGVISNCLFVIERLPSFFIGMSISLYSAKICEKHNRNCMIGIVLISFTGYVITSKMGYPIILSGYAWAALVICVMVSVLLNRFESIVLVQWVKTAFVLLGSISLEMYLHNIYISKIAKMVFSNRDVSMWLQYMVVVIIGTAMSYIVFVLRRNRSRRLFERTEI